MNNHITYTMNMDIDFLGKPEKTGDYLGIKAKQFTAWLPQNHVAILELCSEYPNTWYLKYSACGGTRAGSFLLNPDEFYKLKEMFK